MLKQNEIDILEMCDSFLICSQLRVKSEYCITQFYEENLSAIIMNDNIPPPLKVIIIKDISKNFHKAFSNFGQELQAIEDKIKSRIKNKI